MTGGFSKNFIFYSLANISVGFAKGFCDQTGTELSNYFLFAVPAINGLMGIIDGASIATRGKQVTGNYPYFMEEVVSGTFEEIEEPEKLKRTRAFFGGVFAGFGEGASAAVQMGLGYIAGRYMGYRSIHQ